MQPSHQTLIVMLAYAFKPLQLAPGMEAVLLMVLTATGSFALYEAVRRLPLVRPLFGLARAALRSAHAATDAAASASAPAAATR